VYDCTLAELKARFGGFQKSDRRPQLFARLESFLLEAQASGLVISIVVDGSFTTAKAEPNDIDLILIIAPNHDFHGDLTAAQYGVLSKRRVYRRHGFDVLVASENSEEHRRYVRFLQQIRFEPGQTKGIIQVRI
jgi:hypothetical protein